LRDLEVSGTRRHSKQNVDPGGKLLRTNPERSLV
jgi:hypothetical protein